MISTRLARGLTVLALTGAVVALAALLVPGSNPYVVRAVFTDVGGLVTGFRVRIDGASVGTVSNLTLDQHDHVVATLDIERSAGPVGANATATVRAADLLGEKYVDLDPGNRQDPVPSGTTIPMARTGLAVELDDVLNALDVPTRDALHEFINEDGVAFAGGQNLAGLLAALPPSLDQTQLLLGQLGQNNAALGRLVDESDRVVAAVTAQRGPLTQLVGSTASTLNTLAGRSSELGQTITNAPATLTALRSALAALEGAAIPLGPAAQGLAATAPPLTATLEQLPGFYQAARPTLQIVRHVAPTLTTLGERGTPVVRRLRPLTSELGTFASAFGPVSATLDSGIANLLGFMDGWAQATQARDGASHVFRFGLTVSAATFGSLTPLLRSAGGFPRTFTATPAASTPGTSSTSRPGSPAAAAALTAPTGAAQASPGSGSGLGGIGSAIGQTLQRLGLRNTQPASPSQPSGTLARLLDFLLK